MACITKYLNGKMYVKYELTRREPDIALGRFYFIDATGFTLNAKDLITTGRKMSYIKLK